jgi:hypothetical protein
VLAPHILDTNEVEEKDSDSLKRDVLGPNGWTQQEPTSQQEFRQALGAWQGCGRLDAERLRILNKIRTLARFHWIDAITLTPAAKQLALRRSVRYNDASKLRGEVAERLKAAVC